jgi:hypothetical protein
MVKVRRAQSPRWHCSGSNSLCFSQETEQLNFKVLLEQFQVTQKRHQALRKQSASSFVVVQLLAHCRARSLISIPGVVFLLDVASSTAVLCWIHLRCCVSVCSLPEAELAQGRQRREQRGRRSGREESVMIVCPVVFVSVLLRGAL